MASNGSKLYPFRVDTVLEGGLIFLTKLPPLKVYQFNLSSKLKTVTLPKNISLHLIFLCERLIALIFFSVDTLR